MARRILDRRALRDMAEAAEASAAASSGATARSPASSKRNPASGRMKMVWMVYDAAAHHVATFDFADKAKADRLAARLTSEKGSTHFVRQVKQPMT